MAIRMALGSTRSGVIALVVKEGLAMAVLGSAFGLIGSFLVGRAMQSTLFGISAMDFSVFVPVAFLPLLAALLACLVPARRAACVEPMQALRTE
jgi:putative ABC transport system permease protein